MQADVVNLRQLEATPMNSDDITHEQVAEIAKALYPGTNYLIRLKTRMEKKGFPTKDPVYVLVCAAYEAAVQRDALSVVRWRWPIAEEKGECVAASR